jgi:Nif-specific regulatory protein
VSQCPRLLPTEEGGQVCGVSFLDKVSFEAYAYFVKPVFQTLYEISQVLNSTLDPQQLLTTMMDLVIQHAEAERGFISMKGGLDIARNMEKESIEQCMSKTVVHQLYEEKKPILSVDAQVEPRFQGSESIVQGRVRSICAVPLIHGGATQGIIYVDSALKKGIFDEETLHFLELFSNIATLSLINAVKFSELKKERKILKSRGLGELIGISEPMQAVFATIKKAASISCPVFIQGESGTGKELVARAIHSNSERAGHEFVPLYCGGLPETLIESELFGYRKGAFTGANKDRQGLFETATNGTLFLDEICDVPLTVQSKLLRVLQEGEIRRLGDTKTLKIDVRVVSATNRDPHIEMKEKRFREDLYYRLNVLTMKLPSLRRRGEDIPILATHFLEKYGKRYGKEGITFSSSAIERLKNLDWRGNVREFENFVQRVLVTTAENPIPESAITQEDTQVGWLSHQEGQSRESNLTLRDAEKQIVMERLKSYDGNKSETARSLDMPLRTLYHKLKEWEGAK